MERRGFLKACAAAVAGAVFSACIRIAPALAPEPVAHLVPVGTATFRRYHLTGRFIEEGQTTVFRDAGGRLRFDMPEMPEAGERVEVTYWLPTDEPVKFSTLVVERPEEDLA